MCARALEVAIHQVTYNLVDLRYVLSWTLGANYCIKPPHSNFQRNKNIIELYTTYLSKIISFGEKVFRVNPTWYDLYHKTTRFNPYPTCPICYHYYGCFQVCEIMHWKRENLAWRAVSATPNILTANKPALVALFIATVATGTPLGICTTNNKIPVRGHSFLNI